MKKLIEARFNAIRQVMDALEKYKEKFAHLSIMVKSVTKLSVLVQLIVELSSKLQAIPACVAGNKEMARIELAATTNKISNLLKVYAKINRDKNLLNFLITSKHELFKGLRNQQILDYSKVVYEKVIVLGDVLISYGLTPELLEELRNEIRDYGKVINEPRKSVSERKTHNEILADTIAECTELMEGELDPFMELFNDDKDFYLEYKSARMIVDAPTHHRKEKPIEN